MLLPPLPYLLLLLLLLMQCRVNSDELHVIVVYKLIFSHKLCFNSHVSSPLGIDDNKQHC
jgi:hypothetical protein